MYGAGLERMDIAGLITEVGKHRTRRQMAAACGVSMSAIAKYKAGSNPRRPEEIDTRLRAYARREKIPLNGVAAPVAAEPEAAGPSWGAVKEEGEARKARAQARMAEMDEAVKAGELVSVAAVQEERHLVAVGMRRVFDVLVRNLAALGQAPDPGAVRRLVEKARADSQSVHTEVYRGA